MFAVCWCFVFWKWVTFSLSFKSNDLGLYPGHWNWYVVQFSVLYMSSNCLYVKIFGFSYSPSWIIALLWQGCVGNSRRYEPCRAGLPTTDRSQWRVLTKRDPLEEEMVNHSSFLARRTPWTEWKSKEIWYRKMSTPGQKVTSMLLGKSRGPLLTGPERMNWLSPSGNDTQLWMCLEMKVNSSAVKNNIV